MILVSGIERLISFFPKGISKFIIDPLLY